MLNSQFPKLSDTVNHTILNRTKKRAEIGVSPCQQGVPTWAVAGTHSFVYTDYSI